MKEVRLASIKLDSGEEIICYVLDVVDRGLNKNLIIKDPLKVEFVESPRRKAYKFTPWFLLTTSREHEIDMNKIFAITGVYDEEIKKEYTKVFHHQIGPHSYNHTTETGYVGSVNRFRKLLEKIYKEVPSHPDEC